MISRVAAVTICVSAGIGLFALVVTLAGRSASEVLLTLATQGLHSSNSLTETVVKACPVLLCALAASVPGRFGLVNIGAEGQLLLGAIGAMLVVNILPSDTPSIAMLPAMAAGACLFGAGCGLLPGLLRAATHASETVISLLLNYVAGLLVLHLIHGPWRDPGGFGWPQTALLPDAARLSGIGGTRIHVVFFLAMGLCALLSVVARRTTMGFVARLIEANPHTAHYIGIRTWRGYIAAFAVGGLVAGLAGFAELAAIQGRLRDGMSLGYGYAGFFVAWLCRNRFEWLPAGALLFAAVVTGAESLQVVSGMPFATVYLLQALIFLALLAFPAVHERVSRRIEAGAAAS